MEKCAAKRKNSRLRRLWAALLCCLVFFTAGCARKASGENLIFCTDEIYASVLTEFTDASVLTERDEPKQWRGKTMFERVRAGATCQTSAAQALPMLENGIASNWTAQYLSTPVIAVDRDACETEIATWEDLLSGDYNVALAEDSHAQRMILAAIGYAFQADHYMTRPGLNLLKQLRLQKRLVADPANAAVFLCIDTDAARMIREGKKLEIIVPRGGTITFPMGIVGDSLPAFSDGLNEALIRAGFRTQAGADETLYPEASAYRQSAAPLHDAAHFADVTQRVTRDVRRIAYHTRLFSSADGAEHSVFAAVFCVILMLWVGRSISRTMDRRIQKTLFFCAALIVSWVMVRFVKYQAESMDLQRALWYCYYIFQMLLPLGMAHLMILSGDTSCAERWKTVEHIAFFIALFFILAVLTNDWHQKVFEFDDLQNWDGSYRYLPMYYALFGYNLFCLVFCLAVLIVKAWDTPRHWRVIYPVALAALTFGYEFAYIAGARFARESDFTVTIGVLFLLYHETIMLCGLVPVNYGYNRLFAASPLAIQIADKDGNVVLRSANAASLSQKVRAQALEAPQVSEASDTIVYGASIPGGAVFWQEDIRALRRARNEIAQNLEKLKKTNARLSGSYALARRAAAAREQRRLTHALQTEMREWMDQTARAFFAFRTDEKDAREQAGRLLFGLCYIKRRCGLFFCREDGLTVDAQEVSIYLRELAEMAAYARVETMCVCDVRAQLSAGEAMLFYDFFYLLAMHTARSGGGHMLLTFRRDGANVCMELLTPNVPFDLREEKSFCEALARLSGKLDVNVLDDALSVRLTLAKPREEEATA